MPLSMNIAKRLKVDEYYTMLDDVEKEIQHYKHLLFGKSVYCCCDHPKYSSFYKCLCSHFEDWGLKEVVCSCKSYKGKEALVARKESSVSNDIISVLKGDGSFDSKECLDLILKADVIITNPPFSLAQAFINYMIDLNKKFIIVCNRNTVFTKAVFPFIMDGRVKYGYGFTKRTAYFTIPPMLYGYYNKDVVRGEQNIVRFRNVVWLTNFDVRVPIQKRFFNKNYSPLEYDKYDQYEAINVDKIQDIPKDYYGVMGVPITFLEGFDSEEFELLGLDRFMPLNKGKKRFTIKGKEKYARLLIKRKK